MSTGSLRFIHAADLHLERMPRGVAEVPAHLRELLLESPYRAAERVFETALAERAEFLILSGDVLDLSRAGIRGPLFLAEQFARLAERGIKVYWAGGSVDRTEDWPAEIELPDTVHRFHRETVETVIHRRDEEPVACILATSRGTRREIHASEFKPEASGLTTIAIAHGPASRDALEARRIHYWALGGEHERTTLFHAGQAAHYAGTPQGRQPSETGQHGCTLVEINSEGRVQIVPRATDVLRWQTQRVLLDTDANAASLRRTFEERITALRDASPGTDLLVTWLIAGRGKLVDQLRRTALDTELLAELREKFGHKTPAAWSLALDLETPDALPDELYKQDTILGDFLRASREFAQDTKHVLNLPQPEHPLLTSQEFAEYFRIDDAVQRSRLMREVAVIGNDSLNGGEEWSMTGRE